jgi:glutamine---fructose-6-phosphate transaminase (isomerizing)
MCGIVGYLGSGDGLEVVVGGLEKLEYRGYDSAGVALIERGQLQVIRAVGKLAALKRELVQQRGAGISEAHCVIGHTRWATHGKPSENNAHPHTAGRVSLVHNGIIENYLALRKQLEAAGDIFQSETDTEIAAHLLNHALAQAATPLAALAVVCEQIRGSYSFLAIDSQRPDRLLVAKSATPLILGVGEGEMFVASDIPAILAHTRRIIVLEDGDIAEVRLDGVTILHHGQPVERPIETIAWDPVTAQKGGFKHYMLKEIHDQVQVLADAFRGRIELESPQVILPGITLSDTELKALKRIVLVACGTAWHSCLLGKFYIEELTRIPCEVDYASEFRYRAPVLDKDTLVIAVSQSGETADTLAALEYAGKTCHTMAVCNVLGSSLVRKAKSVVFTQAGPEISVASTKAFTTQLVCLYLVATSFGIRRGTLAVEQVRSVLDDLTHLPSAVAQALEVEQAVERVAKSYFKARDFLFLGRGSCYPIALEGALKLKEISYIHAEGYPAGEMKHGPIALIDERMPIVAVVQHDPLLVEKMISNLKEVEARDGKLIIITDIAAQSEIFAGLKADIVTVPSLGRLLAPIILTVPLQLLAYYVAVLNGTDVDLPRNLAKSVTVE